MYAAITLWLRPDSSFDLPNSDYSKILNLKSRVKGCYNKGEPNLQPGDRKQVWSGKIQAQQGTQPEQKSEISGNIPFQLSDLPSAALRDR